MHPVRPRILLVIDKPNWAFDRKFKGLRRLLGDTFDFRALYVNERPLVLREEYDLVHVYFWGESYHLQWRPGQARVIKGVHSHRWEHDPRWGVSGPSEFAERYLSDAATIETSSPRLANALSPWRDHVEYLPQPLSVSAVPLSEAPAGPLSVGWAGNPRDPEKNFEAFFPSAVPEAARFMPATGQYSLEQMESYYAGLDVLCVTSRSEGMPQPLVDALAAGCYVVATDVGLVPELITPGFNGCVIPADPAALRSALEQCVRQVSQLRQRRREISERFRTHWNDDLIRDRWRDFYQRALDRAEAAGAARVQPGVGHLEEDKVISRFRWPARKSAIMVEMKPLGDALPDRLAAGHELSGTVLASSGGVSPLIRQLAQASAGVTSVSQTLSQRVVARGLNKVSRTVRRIGFDSLAHRIDRVPTRYDVALRGLHSDC